MLTGNYNFSISLEHSELWTSNLTRRYILQSINLWIETSCAVADKLCSTCIAQFVSDSSASCSVIVNNTTVLISHQTDQAIRCLIQSTTIQDKQWLIDWAGFSVCTNTI